GVFDFLCIKYSCDFTVRTIVFYIVFDKFASVVEKFHHCFLNVDILPCDCIKNLKEAHDVQWKAYLCYYYPNRCFMEHINSGVTVLFKLMMSNPIIYDNLMYCDTVCAIFI